MTLFRRYSYILLVYVLLLFLGQRVVPPSSFTPDQEVYGLKVGVNSQKLFASVPTKADQGYRVSFAVRILPNDLSVSNEFNSVKRILSVSHSSPFIGEQKVTDITLEPTTRWQYFSTQFTGSGAEEDVLIAKTERTERFTIAVNPLTISSIAPTGNYRPTLFGTYSAADVVLGDPSRPVGPIKLLGHSRILAQTFTADFEYLEGVRLPLTFHGYGGSRDYEASIYEIGDSKLGARLASITFNKGTAEEYRVAGTDYELPLFAHLKVGNNYAVVVDGQSALVSPFHYLALSAVGTSNSQQLFRLSSLSNELRNGLTNSVDITLISGKPTLLDGQAMVSGQVVEDLGGTLLNSFRLNPEPSNNADIFEYNTTSGNGRPAFSHSDRVLESLAQDGSYYRYKIPLGGQLKQAELSFRTTDPASEAIHVSYSLDGNSWQRLTADTWSRSGDIRRVITGKSRTIWIEVSYKPIHDSQKVYGLKSLQVTAEVIK